jgi:putative ABC transport system ATP-binding protein
MASIITVKDITKTFHMGDVEVNALRGVNLEIEKGEFVAIMGSSGSGKSTFMNIIGCLDVPTSGEYVLDGVLVNTLKKDQLAELRNKKIGFVFQSFNLLSRTSALENIELPLVYNNKMSPRQRKEKAMEALRIVGLSDRASHMPNQLSGGQQQRIAIARALVNEPVILLADEPTGNLDTRTSFEIMDIFQKLHDKGITIILVTHENDIASFATDNVMFRDGLIRDKIIVKSRKMAAEEIKNFSLQSN